MPRQPAQESREIARGTSGQSHRVAGEDGARRPGRQRARRATPGDATLGVDQRLRERHLEPAVEGVDDGDAQPRRRAGRSGGGGKPDRRRMHQPARGDPVRRVVTDQGTQQRGRREIGRRVGDGVPAAGRHQVDVDVHACHEVRAVDERAGRGARDGSTLRGGSAVLGGAWNRDHHRIASHSRLATAETALKA